MTSSMPPRRRASPAVYRRRRLVVLLALVVVIALVWLLIAQPWRGAAADGQDTSAADPTPSQSEATNVPAGEDATPTPTATSTPSATSTPTPKPKPTPSTTSASAPKCKSADLLVEPVTDKETYKSSQKPKLSIALTNTGDTDCTVNVGTSTQKFVISSGGDTWWRSTDCQSTPSDQIVLLAAGQKVTSATPLVWDRTRSSVKTCTSANRQKAPGGGASYHLGVEIGGVSSDSTQQFLLY
jgi:hypothetical protein